MTFDQFYLSYGWVIYVGGVVVLFALWFIGRAIVNKIRRVDYAGKHVLVTGGSEGMGFAVASKMVDLGAHVTILARRKEKLDEALKAIEKHRHNEDQSITAFPCDVTDFSVVEKVVKNVEEVRPIDVLVNCAGRSSPGMFTDVPITDFEDMLQVNYLGQVNMARAVLPLFKARNAGQIVFTTSTLALCVIPGYSSYAAAKFAVTGMAAALSYEVHSFNIDISVCYPPTMDTPGLKVENEKKPALTWEIESSVDMFAPAKIADLLLPQMAQKRYHICFDFFTWMCRVVDTPLLTPRDNIVLEFMLLPWFALMNVVMIPVIQSQVRGFFAKQKLETVGVGGESETKPLTETEDSL